MYQFGKKVIKAALRRLGYEIYKTNPVKPAVSEHGATASFELLLDQLRGTQIKLHFGCGPRILKGWINFDLSYEHFANYLQYYGDKYYPPELRGSPSDLVILDVTRIALPFPNNSVDVIFHEDFIEHLSQRDQVRFLAETHRVLKPGAIHRVSTPNLWVSMRDHSDFAAGFDGVYTQEWDRHKHLNVLTPSVLKELARMVGY